MKKPFFYTLIAAALVGSAILIKIVGDNAGLAKDTWPGWVQAIGSIAALAVAIFVMSRQNAHAARLISQADQLSLRRRAQAISVIMESAHRQVGHCLSKVRNGVEKMDLTETQAAFVSAKHFMGDTHRTLASIPLHDLGSADMADGILRIKQVASVLIATSELELNIDGFAGLRVMLGALTEKSDSGIKIFCKGVADQAA